MNDLNEIERRFLTRMSKLGIKVRISSNFRAVYEVDGLDYRELGITHLPMVQSLYVNGDLILRDTKMRRLPRGLIVRGDLDIRDTYIKHIPSSMEVMGDVYMDDDTVLKSKNYGVKIHGKIHRKADQQGQMSLSF